MLLELFKHFKGNTIAIFVLGRQVQPIYFNHRMTAFYSGLLCLVLYAPYIHAVQLTGKSNHYEILRFDFILSDITNCIWRYKALNIFHSTRRTFLCMSDRISRCVVSEAADYVRDGLLFPDSRPTYCGVIASSGRIDRMTGVFIKIKTYLNHVLHIEVNRFNFEWRRTGCIVHNMVVIDSADNNRILFCGKRLPWTMITSGHEAEVHITTYAYRNYQLSSFYSSYMPQWFDTFATNHRLYVKSSASSNLNLLHVFQRFEINVMNYFLLADSWQVVEISVMWKMSGRSNTRLVIHDGPGHLSGILVKHTGNSENNTSIVRTTAFSAFIQITYSWIENKSIEITTATVSGRGYFPDCNLNGNSATASSNGDKNIVCFFKFHTPTESIGQGIYTAYTAIYIDKFTFNGPQALVDDSPHNCHYGGMYISHLIDISHRMVPFCENKHKIYVSGRYIEMAVLIVWYAKYTSGSFDAKFTATRCFVTYLTLTHYPNYAKDRSFIYDEPPGCQMFVCASKEEQDQDNCKMIFTTKSGVFGNSLIKTTLSRTPFNCIPEYSKSISQQTIIYLKAVVSENWPLGKPKTVNIYDQIGKFGEMKKIFLYLYNATAIFNDVCEGPEQMQILLTLTISVCQKTYYGKYFVRLPGYINAASASCYSYPYVIKHYLENATHLLYKEGIHEHKGGILRVEYAEDCPLKCRNYTFVLLIVKRSQNRIEEYRLDVGNTLFLGLSHNGFRLTVQPPILKCRCSITVLMEHPKQKIIKRKEKPQFWTSPAGDLYTKRYVPIFVLLCLLTAE